MEKKVKKTKNIKNITKNNNTIFISVILVIISIVSIVEFAMYIYIKDSITTIRHNTIVEYITSLKSFNYNLATANFDKIKNSINETQINTSNLLVQQVIITDKNNKEIYSTFKEPHEISLSNPENPATLKIEVQKDISNLLLFYIDYQNFNIYLFIPKNSFSYIQDITNFLKILFGIIMLASIIISYLFARSISNPLTMIEKNVFKIAKEGDLSIRLSATRYYEINQLIFAYNQMVNTLQKLYSSLEIKVQERTQELKSAYAELQNTQAMMVHSEKMKSLGELVAGIMHEINNPINFIYGNMTHLRNYSEDLINIIEKYDSYENSLKTEEKTEIDKYKEELDYEFLKNDIPDLIKSCKEGAERAKNIIQDLKSFSRMEGTSITDVDLPHEIDVTLNILHNKLKNKAEIHKEYDENICPVEAFGGQLNQVFMNILDNAAGAIQDKGDIWIRLKADEEKKNIIIEIEDNGIGMDEETARKVFNPFFTTKPVGQGTGLGMSITYKIIKNHKGDIRVESTPNVGTKFIISMPITIDRDDLSVSAEAGGTNE